VGDVGQHHAVERGQAFDLLQKFGGLEVASVETIQRQKGDYKTAVEQIAQRDFEGAFETFEKMGAFQVFPEMGERQQALAADYVAMVGNGNTALVVSPTHAECEDITQAIRHALKEKRSIGEGQEQQVLRNLSWTAAEKRNPLRYETGVVVQITQPIEGFSKGEQAEVVETKDGMVCVRCANGDLKNLPFEKPEKFHIFKRESIEICKGDRVRITANGWSADRHRLNNGSLYTVAAIDPDGRIILDNGWRLEKDFGHLAYGYATTSHASQGKTVDWVLLAQSGLLSSSASDARQFYVSVSRGRHGVKIYTDDIEALRENVARVRERPMAMEITAKQEQAAWQLGGQSTATVKGLRETALELQSLPRIV
jgi:ATP-dependent exoDNAse (exonuclease V) alpha subunit